MTQPPSPPELSALKEEWAEIVWNGLMDHEREPEHADAFAVADLILDHLATVTAERDALEKKLETDVYQPGIFRCAKCGFRVVQSNLNANTGSITARDAPGDNCPNDGSPLWRVTWREDAEGATKWGEEQFDKRMASEAENLKLREAGGQFVDEYFRLLSLIRFIGNRDNDLSDSDIVADGGVTSLDVVRQQAASLVEFCDRRTAARSTPQPNTGEAK